MDDEEEEESQGRWQHKSGRGFKGWVGLGDSVPFLCLPEPVPGPTPHPRLCFAEQVEGRLGPSTVVLDHTGGFEGLLLVDDDLLGVSKGKAWGPRSKPLLMWPIESPAPKSS